MTFEEGHFIKVIQIEQIVTDPISWQLLFFRKKCNTREECRQLNLCFDFEQEPLGYVQTHNAQESSEFSTF